MNARVSRSGSVSPSHAFGWIAALGVLPVGASVGPRGEVTARELPVYTGFEVVDHCSGHGTWKPLEAARGHRAGVDLAIPDCQDASLSWKVAGTEEHPELFVLMGDPDAGETAVLSKGRSG
ncbi:hypothetical protein [Streptomyces sp. NPDC000460]|uniref:hypothetical protein n=1 Tax=Streptomyces sp. NPDC000460 TaxID=3364539 RepID=UPI0036C1B0C0